LYGKTLPLQEQEDYFVNQIAGDRACPHKSLDMLTHRF